MKKGLTKQLEKQLTMFSEEVRVAVRDEIMLVAKEGADELKETSPKLMGNYAKGWRVNKIGTLDRRATRALIYNGPDYHLTHLLEKGHATRNGKMTKAQPHIKPVEERIIRELPKRIESKIKGG